MGFADKVNYFDLAKNLDFISHDQYPGGFFTTSPHEANETLSAALDLMRGTKNQSFWIMEQQAGITGWETMGRAPEPGQLAMWAQHSIAHGADAIVFFRWRTCTVGTEQYWHGILPHSGKPGRTYHELKAMIHKLMPIMPKLQGTVPNAEIAIVYSYDQNYAMKIQPHHPELNYTKHLIKYYNGFYKKNIAVDFVSDKGDFSKYKLVIAPLQYLMNPALEDKYENYVKLGGHLVLTMRTGVKNDNNVCMSDRELPGRLGEVTGIEINDYDCLKDITTGVKWNDASAQDQVLENVAEKWCDIIDLKGARSLADYTTQFYKGTPAITENLVGKGTAVYVGTEPNSVLMDTLCSYLVKTIGIQSCADTPEGVEVSHRRAETTDYIFVINHNDCATEYTVLEDWEPIYEDQSNKLEPYEVSVYTRKIEYRDYKCI